MPHLNERELKWGKELEEIPLKKKKKENRILKNIIGDWIQGRDPLSAFAGRTSEMLILHYYKTRELVFQASVYGRLWWNQLDETKVVCAVVFS